MGTGGDESNGIDNTSNVDTNGEGTRNEGYGTQIGLDSGANGHRVRASR